MIRNPDDPFRFEDELPGPEPAAPAPAAPAAPASTPKPPEFNREGFRDAWMSTGSDRARQDDLLRQNNLTPDGAGRVTLPTGEVIDLRLGARAGGTQATWTGVAGGGAKTGQAPDLGGGGSVGGAMSGSPGSAPGGAFQDQIRALILQQLQGLSQPVDAKDPAIAGEMSAQERVLERMRQQRRAASAERMAANGLNSGGAGSGAFESEIASGFEDKGQALTGLQAQIFTREVQQRRGQLTQLLNLALSSGDAEAARALQLQIAQMDNALRARGLDQAQSQFNDQFGLALNEAQYNRDRDAARARLGLNF